MGKLVRCIDISGSARHYLMIGQVYEVIKEYTKEYTDSGARIYYILQGVRHPWYASRFEDVTEEGLPIMGIDFGIGQDVTINPGVVIPVDNYTCKICANTKCSTTEKSCWKCGALIVS